MKVLIIDRIGIHSGTQYYVYFLKQMFGRIPGCEPEIVSNFNIDGKRPVLLNIYKGSKLSKGIKLFLTFSQLFFKSLFVRKPLYLFLDYGTVVDNLLLIALAPARKKIIDVHELTPKEGLGKFNSLLFKIAFKTFDYSIIHSDASKESLLHFNYCGRYSYVPLYESNIERSYVIENVGLDVQQSVESEKINILFFGSLTAEKGVDLLIESVNLLSDASKSRINVIIAGRPIDDAISLHPSDDSVFKKVIRHIGDDELIYLFSKCDFVAIPYKKTFQSGVMDRAFNFKKPVLTTNLPYFVMMLERYPSFGITSSGCDADSYKSLIERVVYEPLPVFFNNEDVAQFEKKEGVEEFINEMTTYLQNRYGL